jgi:hypothetical protein
MTVQGFAEAEGVVDTSLYKCLRRERAEKKAGPVMVEVAALSGSGTVFSIETPGGYRIEVSPNFSSDALKRLLGVLEA